MKTPAIGQVIKKSKKTKLFVFDWIDFYKKFAQKLLEYRDNRSELIEKIKEIYQTTGIKLPTLEKDDNIADIDPFTVFALFNKGITHEKRKSIITAVKKLFDIDSSVPTGFGGIPVVNNRNATFYRFIGDRKAGDIDNLWGLFVSALTYADNPSAGNRTPFSKYFDLAINQLGNGTSKITMGLFWISPDTFLNLDRTNKAYIYTSNRLPSYVVKTLPSAKGKITSSAYLEILDKLHGYLKSGKSPQKSFAELSEAAWVYSQEKDGFGPDLNSETRYWTYAPGEGAKHWDYFHKSGIMAIGWDEIGDLNKFGSKNEIKEELIIKYGPGSHKNSAKTLWQFSHELKPGDIIFAKKGKYLIVGHGVVESDYEYDESRSTYRHIRKIKWTHRGEWKNPRGYSIRTLDEITERTGYIEVLNELLGITDPDPNITHYPTYSKEDFLAEVYMDETSYDTLASILSKKKNIILQGAPGVGKTFAARRLAYSMMGEKDRSRVMMIQFHQSYSYEDFIMGFRPTESGFELKQGAFYEFCKAAADDDEDNPYFFIIDEINRGNLSKIFGELFMLIESDKRGMELRLLYENEKFSVPKNVYIIGTMNTADRSLAMLDFALRRRFAFFELKPGFDTDGFKAYQDEVDSDEFNKLIETVKQLNTAITADDSLGKGFCLGHSFFCNLDDENDPETRLSEIVDFELVPLLEEYWFDEPDKVSQWSEKLRKSIQ